MPGVAIHGSQIDDVVPGYVTYSIEYWDDDKDADGIPFGWRPAGSGSTNARITGTVNVPSSKMKIVGSNIATVGDVTNETWVAAPPIPSSNSSYRYTATSPTNGGGQGQIISGSTKGKLNGKRIALIGSQVTTCLGTTTTIKTGNERMKFGS